MATSLVRELNRSSGEEIIYAGRLSFIGNMKSEILDLLITLVFAAIIAVEVIFKLNWVLWLITGFIWLIIHLFFACKHILYHSNEVIITDRRIIVKSGLFWTKTRDVPLDKVQTAAVNSTMAGKIFDYGEVSVETSSGVHVMKYIKHPMEFKRQLMLQVPYYSRGLIVSHMDTDTF